MKDSLTEADARILIDDQLRQAGWDPADKSMVLTEVTISSLYGAGMSAAGRGAEGASLHLTPMKFPLDAPITCCCPEMVVLSPSLRQSAQPSTHTSPNNKPCLMPSALERRLSS